MLLGCGSQCVSSQSISHRTCSSPWSGSACRRRTAPRAQADAVVRSYPNVSSGVKTSGNQCARIRSALPQSSDRSCRFCCKSLFALVIKTETSLGLGLPNKRARKISGYLSRQCRAREQRASQGLSMAEFTAGKAASPSLGWVELPPPITSTPIKKYLSVSYGRCSYRGRGGRRWTGRRSACHT
jgi:hypothetical protein